MNRYQIGDRIQWVYDGPSTVTDDGPTTGTIIDIDYNLPPLNSGKTLDPAAPSDDPNWQYVGYRVRFDDGEEETYAHDQIQKLSE